MPRRCTTWRKLYANSVARHGPSNGLTGGGNQALRDHVSETLSAPADRDLLASFDQAHTLLGEAPADVPPPADDAQAAAEAPGQSGEPSQNEPAVADAKAAQVEGYRMETADSPQRPFAWLWLAAGATFVLLSIVVGAALAHRSTLVPRNDAAMLELLTYRLAELLYQLSTALLLPIMLLVSVLLVVMLIALGGLLREWTERRQTREALHRAAALLATPSATPDDVWRALRRRRARSTRAVDRRATRPARGGGRGPGLAHRVGE